ncbi:MAG TPA: energy transducer TonB [Longimicrobium sp.]
MTPRRIRSLSTALSPVSKKALSAALLAAALAVGASSAGLAQSGGPRPCAYEHGTALTHLPDGRTLAEAWEAARTGPLPDPRPDELVMLPLVPGASEPEAVNGMRVATMLARNYPPELRDAGITGTTVLLVWIGADGRVAEVRVVRPASDLRFDEAAVRVIRFLRFRPSRVGDCAVAGFHVVPVSFLLS